MNTEIDSENRAVKVGLKIAETKFGAWLFTKPCRIHLFLFLFLAFCHSIYWLTAHWSPWPFIIFNLIGVWVGGGILKPWATIINQAMQQPNYDLSILKISVPFIALNWVAIFACLYMFGSVLENGVQIEGAWKHFYFSAVTLTTLGYGNIVPASTYTEAIATIESLIGFLGFAILAGIITSITIKRFE